MDRPDIVLMLKKKLCCRILLLAQSSVSPGCGMVTRRFRAVLGVFTTIMNTIVTSFLYSTVFPPRTLEGWQAFGPSMAGSFWVFYHMNRYSPIIPFYFQYVFFGCIAFIHLAGLPRVCRTDRNLQWLASKFFGGLLSLCSLFEYSRRVWKPRLVHFLEGPPWQCTLFQGFTLIVFGFLLVSHMTFVWELRLRKRYAVDRLSRRTAKRLLEDSPSSVDHFMYFGIPGVCIVVLFALKLGIFDRLV